jgi:adenylate kinase
MTDSLNIIYMGQNKKHFQILNNFGNVSVFSDLELIENINLIVADVTLDSLEQAFILSKAHSMKKKVIIIYDSSVKKYEEIPSLIRDTNFYFIEQYERENDFYFEFDIVLKIKEFLERELFIVKPKIWITGPPGCGKGTLSKKIAEKYNLHHISTGDILRNYVQDHKDDLSNQIKTLMNKGELIPSNIMFQIVNSIVSDTKYISRGYILDGYPPSNGDMNNLICHEYSKPDFVIKLNCSDEICIERQVKRDERPTSLEKAKKRIEIYKEKIPNFSSFPILEFNSMIDKETLFKNVCEIIEGRITLPKNKFFVTPLLKNKNSNKFHFHIDADNVYSLLKIADEIIKKIPELGGQIKIYPISSLSVGPQSKNVEYNSMINFREFYNQKHEAFLTGSLGETLDSLQIEKILNICKKIGGCMMEIEEYLYLDDKKLERVPFILPENFKEYECKHKEYEYHHGLDIAKKNDEKLFLTDLQKITEHLDVGGWFIFSDENKTCLRSNSFSDTFDVNRLRNEQHFLEFFKTKIKSSIEAVLGIWVFP